PPIVAPGGAEVPGVRARDRRRSSERYPRRAVDPTVDGEEVAAVGCQVAIDGLQVVRDKLGWVKTVGVAVDVEGRPEPIHVELDRADRAGPDQDRGQSSFGVVGRGVDQVAVTVDTDACPPGRFDKSEHPTPDRLAAEIGCGTASVYEQVQVLARERDPSPPGPPRGPSDDVDAAVAVSNQRPEPA